MQVTLLTCTESPLAAVYLAFKQCYSRGSADTYVLPSTSVMEDFVREVVASGHTSPIEHVSFTFSVSGVSRALTHQLVRHRIGSYCVSKDTKIKTSSQKTNNKTIEELFCLPAQYKNSLKLRCVNEHTGGVR